MEKYIIKTCPAYEYDEDFKRHICKRNLAIYETTSDECEDCTDCLLKRIVELCRDEMRFDRKSDLSLATDIMSFLEIEVGNKQEEE